MKKIMFIFGTRPEAIKMCPVVNQFKKMREFDVTVCVTGQHKEMLKQVLDVFSVVPEYNLDIMKPKQDLFDITTEILSKIKIVIAETKPDLIVVHGDTTTALTAAIASFYLKIPVAHVEAGLRTNDLYAPFPEEFNRHTIGVIADLHFAPTELAKSNLLKENVSVEKIFVTGNTAIDALRTTVKTDYDDENIRWANDSQMILVTAHRRENIGKPMENMFRAIKHIVDEDDNVKVIYPIHMNPVVREIAKRILGKCDRIRLIEPLNVLDFHNYMSKATLILTDSGGIQEEAPSLGKPVLVMRDVTERPEGVEAGTLKIVGTQEENIYKNIYELLHNEALYKKMSFAQNPYGDGHASEKIAARTKEYFESKR